MNSLPVTDEPVQWISTFREELRLLLGDVDRVGINININCDLQNPEEYRPRVSIKARNATVHDREIKVAAMPRDGDRSDQFIEEMRAQGFPFELYHAPNTFSY